MTFSLGPRAASAGYRLIAFNSVGSTNAEALRRAREGEHGPVWFVTSEQTAGRGRRHRPWIAARGNLAASVLEVMHVPPSAAATLGFAAGLALVAALRSAGSDEMELALKWPNDVMAGGKKLAGILLEAEAVEHRLAVVVGIGTNVVAAPEATPYPATSLVALGIELNAPQLFAALSNSWTEFREIWDQGRGFAEIRQRWLQHAEGRGKAVSVSCGGSILRGEFETINETGCMIIATSDGRRVPVSAGDVYFGAAASAGVT
jgi:BirA family transcriptional regulator, biotin operon repressor / biotin---[acetyl-CoA-carboxylase] ligase